MQFNTENTTIEEFALNLAWDDLPERIQDRAVMCGIDLMCALVLGSRSRQFESGKSLARDLGLAGDIPVVGGGGETFNLLGATMAMGHASNSFDIDDGFNLIKGHPGTSFVAGAMAGALEADASLRDYLTTLVACYESTIRWALAMQDHYGYLHSTGTYGAFGTALALGRWRGLDVRQLKNALSVADFHAPITPVMRAVEYPSMNKDGVPFGALVGAMAVLETQHGVTGRTHFLECPDYGELLDTLGKRYYMEELYFKPYTCCRWAHQPIVLCQRLMGEHGFTHEDVERATVHTFKSAAALYKERPRDTDEAQYNIAYPVACALVAGDVGYDQVRDEALGDERVLAMMDRLHFVVDDALEARFPEERLAWVEIELVDGRRLQSEVTAAPGENTDPALGIGWARDKFVRRTASLLSADAQRELLDAFESREGSMRAIIAALNSHLA